MTLATEIADMVSATATRPFDEPLSIRLPPDEWRAVQMRAWREEAESRRVLLTPMEPSDSLVIYTAFGEVVFRKERAITMGAP